MENFSNFYATLLSGAINNSVTALTVDSAIGAPGPNFRLLVQDGEDDPTNRELMLVTAVAGEVFTVERGIEDTTAVAHADNSFIAHVVTAGGMLQGIYDRSSNIGATIAVVMDGGDDLLQPGEKVDLAINFSATITGWEILAASSGSVVIDIWKDIYTNYPPTVADSICGAGKPTLTSGLKAEGEPTGWSTVTIFPGETLRFKVDSASTLVRVTLLLHVQRN